MRERKLPHIQGESEGAILHELAVECKDRLLDDHPMLAQVLLYPPPGKVAFLSLLRNEDLPQRNVLARVVDSDGRPPNVPIRRQERQVEIAVERPVNGSGVAGWDICGRDGRWDVGCQARDVEDDIRLVEPVKPNNLRDRDFETISLMKTNTVQMYVQSSTFIVAARERFEVLRDVDPEVRRLRVVENVSMMHTPDNHGDVRHVEEKETKKDAWGVTSNLVARLPRVVRFKSGPRPENFASRAGGRDGTTNHAWPGH